MGPSAQTVDSLGVSRQSVPLARPLAETKAVVGEGAWMGSERAASCPEKVTVLLEVKPRRGPSG